MIAIHTKDFGSESCVSFLCLLFKPIFSPFPSLPKAPSFPAMALPSSRLHILFFPFPSPGHYIPMLDIAALLASHGAAATFVVSPIVSARLSPSVHRAASAGLPLRLHTVPFPSAAAGLPAGVETADAIPNALSQHFGAAVFLLRDPYRDLLRRLSPDAVVADAFLAWTATDAASLAIPWYAFPGTGLFALSVDRSLQSNRPDSDPFLVPGLPDRVQLTRSRLKETTLLGENVREFFDVVREADRFTAGIVVNTFPDLEPGYAEHYEKETGKRIYMIGPVSLVGCRGGKGDCRILEWLDRKPAGSVIYVCFGSLCRVPAAQTIEIGLGLEESGVDFVWVIRVPPKEAEEVVVAVEGRVGERGMVVRGWVPGQAAAVRHPAVGGFMTHCGWGAVTEAAAAGVPALTWPMFAEQFYNEKMVAEVTGIGAGVGAERGFVWGEEERGGVVVGRESIRERVRWLMAGGGGEGGGGEAEAVRRRAREMGEKARRAVAEGGSSYVAAEKLLQDMRRLSPRMRSPAAAKVRDFCGGGDC